MDIQTLHQQFIEECRNGTLQKRSEKTIQNYERSIKLLLRWFSLQNIQEIQPELLRQFFQRGERMGSYGMKWQPATVITHRKNLNSFLDWCTQKKYLLQNPLDEIPVPKVLKKIPEIYSEEEIEKILYTVAMHSYSHFEKERDSAIMATLLLTGMRKGELMGLKVVDLDFENRCLRIRAETAKNRRPRVVPICYRLYEILQKYWKAREQKKANTPYFWVSSTHGEKFTEFGLRHLLRRLSEQAGVRIKSHKCRHTFATRFYQGSKDLISLQQMLGHREITTTMIYTQVLPEQTRDSAEKNPISNLI